MAKAYPLTYTQVTDLDTLVPTKESWPHKRGIGLKNCLHSPIPGWLHKKGSEGSGLGV